MESNKILGADILDIVFEGRNKEYGAYELRKSYNKRLGRAMAVTGSLIGLLFLSGFVAGHGRKKMKEVIYVKDDSLISVDAVQPPPPLPPAPPAPQVKTIAFVTPKVVPIDQADAPPPENADLENAKIGTVNRGGADDPEITAPPAVSDGKGIVEAPKKEEDDGAGFVKIEKESEFPGGAGAWLRYLGRNLRTPDAAIQNEIQGTVVVKFMVDPDGNVSDVEAISGPTDGGLREEAVRVIKKSGKWTPALQNGRYVRSYKQQPITFVIAQ